MICTAVLILLLSSPKCTRVVVDAFASLPMPMPMLRRDAAVRHSAAAAGEGGMFHSCSGVCVACAFSPCASRSPSKPRRVTSTIAGKQRPETEKVEEDDSISLEYELGLSNNLKKQTNSSGDNTGLQPDNDVKAKVPENRKRKRKAKSKVDASSNPAFWLDQSDEFCLHDLVNVVDGELFATDGDASEGNSADAMETKTNTRSPATTKMIKFTVRGKPVPLRRHRTARGFTYNPSASLQEEFRDVVLSLLPPQHYPTFVDDGSVDDAARNSPNTLFDEHEFLSMKIVFRLKRPKSHFVGGKPGPDRIRPTSPGKLYGTRTDVDNLAKFVMDSLNGVLFTDDRQVVSLHATKVLDTEGMCEGATEVYIRNLEESDMWQ